MFPTQPVVYTVELIDTYHNMSAEGKLSRGDVGILNLRVRDRRNKRMLLRELGVTACHRQETCYPFVRSLLHDDEILTFRA